MSFPIFFRTTVTTVLHYRADCDISLFLQALPEISDDLIFSKIAYDLPAFAGLISVTDKNRINNFFRKAHRRGLVLRYFDIDALITCCAVASALC